MSTLLQPRRRGSYAVDFFGLLLFSIALFCIKLIIKTTIPSTSNNRYLKASQEYSLPHGFTVLVSGDDNIEIVHENRVLWKGCEACFVKAADGNAWIREERGSFVVRDHVCKKTDRTTITQVTMAATNDRLILQGDLLEELAIISWFLPWAAKMVASYQLDIFTTNDTSSQLSFHLTLQQNRGNGEEVAAKRLNRLYLQHQILPDELFFGFGEQFTKLNMKGKKVTIITSENGIVRGKPSLLNDVLFLVGVNGRFDSTYAPAPYYFTNHNRAFFLENYEISQFDMRDDSVMAVKLHGTTMRGRWIAAATPLDILESYTGFAGRMQPLPDWMNRGAVVGMQGGTDRVLSVYEQLTALDTPIAAFWLQDWVGKRQTTFGSQLWWNWVLDKNQYPNWDMMVSKLQENDIRVMTYISPFLVDPPPEQYQQEERLYDVAQANGYFVLDNNGEKPYLIPNTDFSASLIDLTNPDAREWMKGIIKKNVIGVRASGWMADFGEALPLDATLFSREDAEVYHNKYPEEWARLNQEAVAEVNRTGDIVFFTRSGFTRSPSFSTLFWEGDQMVTWDKYDGLKSAITGLLSSGLSGFSLNHNDIGGYTSVSVPFLFSIVRSRQLLLRWIEMNAFTAVFRTHEGIQPSKNVQFYSDSGTLRHFATFAKVYAALSPYRKSLMNEAAEKGYPIVRHPLLHFPGDPVAYDLKYQWMLGPDFMVIPVTEEDQVIVRGYLPRGSWVHIWSCDSYGGGIFYDFDAPPGKPVVLFQKGSTTGQSLLETLHGSTNACSKA